MGDDVRAVFAGDIGPMEKAMAQLRSAMKANAEAVRKDLTFTPKIDDTALKASMANIQTQMKQWQSGAFSKPSGGGNAYLENLYANLPQNDAQNRRGGASSVGANSAYRAGMVGQQMQDIAVQLQGGTSPLVVMAQQGSQLASIFGPQGMLIGGAIAVGGALLTMGHQAQVSFDRIITGARDSHKEVAKLLADGGSKELMSGVDSLSAKVANLRKERFALDGLFSQASTMYGVLTGGDDIFTKRQKLKDQEQQGELDKLKVETRLVASSKEGVTIARLIASGRKEEADEMARSLALAKALRTIDESEISSSGRKDSLKKDVQDIYDAGTAQRADEKNQKHLNEKKALGDEVTKQLQANAEAQAKADFDQLDAAQQMESVHQRMAQLKNLSDGKDPLADARRGSEMIDLKVKEFQLQKQIADQTARASKEQEAFNQMVDDTNAEIGKEQRDKAEKEAKAMTTLQRQAGLQHLRATGHGKDANKIEKNLAIEEQAQKIATDTGMPIEKARTMAKGMAKDQETLANSGRHRIHGGRSSTDWGIGAAQFPGLENAEANRGKRLKDTFQFPALEAMAKRQAHQAGNKDKQNAGKAADGLLQDAVNELKALNNKLNIVN